uniref:Uncharacterized protein n=1 Tax=Arundo donax TaxID=35708 RepID=A0A0A8XWR7_ARUDO
MVAFHVAGPRFGALTPCSHWLGAWIQ